MPRDRETGDSCPKQHGWIGPAALGVAGLAAYGALVPPHRPVLVRQRVALAGLPPELAGLRVVQISDLHLSELFRPAFLRPGVALANSARPDIVLITGDFVARPPIVYLPDGLRELATLRPSIGRFAALGNHDHWNGAEAVRDCLDADHFPLLVNDRVRVRDGLWIAALDDLMAGQPNLEQTVRGIPENEAVILISHNPIILPKVADHPWLVVSGHTHGGQLALPILGPAGTMRMPGSRFVRRKIETLMAKAHNGRLDALAIYRYPVGWYRQGRAQMYVNRGIGVSRMFPIRLNCPPEVTCFELHPA